MKKLFSFIFAILLVLSLSAQNKTTDSLKMLLQNENSESGRAGILYQMGRLRLSDLDANDSSLSYLWQALVLTQKISDTHQEIRVRNAMSELYNFYNNYPEALELSFQTLKLARQAKDTLQILWATREIMKTYYGMGDYNKALEYTGIIEKLLHSKYFKDSDSLEFYKTIGYINFRAGSYEGIKQYDSALHYRLISHKFSLSGNDPQGTSISLVNLGNLYAKMKNADSALTYWERGIPYTLRSGRMDLWVDANLGIAGLLKQRGKTDSSIFYARQALDRSGKIKYNKGLMIADSLLSELYAGDHRFDSAYKYMKSFMAIKDKVFGRQKAVQIQNITFNETLRQERLEQERKEAQQQYVSRLKIYSLLAGLSMLLILALILYRSNKQKHKANIQIDRSFKELQATQAQLVQSEKMASLGELTAGIAHEIQNPLNFVNNFSEVNEELIKELTGEADKGNLEEVKAIANDIAFNSKKINHHGKRADTIVKGMLQHSRTSSGQKEPTDINVLADEYLRLAYHGLRAKDKSFNADIKTDFDENIGKVNIIPQDIGRVVLNLINNAFYAVDEKKKHSQNGYEPTVSVSTKKSSGKVEIRVNDNGNGIPPKVVDKIFQPFFTTKPTGQGTGLGLSLSYDIIKAHGGEIKVETKENEGTEFIIKLPVISK